MIDLTKASLPELAEHKSRLVALPFGRFPFPAHAFAKIMEALPEDAVIMRQYEQSDTLEWMLVIHSRDFLPVEDKKPIPRLNASVTKDVSGVLKATITAPVSASSFLEELENL